MMATILMLLINVIQNEVFLSEAEAYQCTWAAIANWKGGEKKNMEIDLLQENCNADLKKLIKNMGMNKTDKAVGGLRQIVDNFDRQTSSHSKSTQHGHASSSSDESEILQDLQNLKPFVSQLTRKLAHFSRITLDSLDRMKFAEWLRHHKNNIMYNAPHEEEDNFDEEEYI